MNKAIFLDRDGTINIDKEYLYKIEDFEFTYKAVEALELLKKNGYKIVIVTNQSGIARGFYSEEDVTVLHDWLVQYLSQKGIHIDGIYYCPHHPDGVIKKYAIECNCRKPALGLYYKAIEELNVDTAASFAVGDNLRDLSICSESNIKGILISDQNMDPKGSKKRMTQRDGAPELANEIEIVPNLFEAALLIIKKSEALREVMNRS